MGAEFKLRAPKEINVLFVFVLIQMAYPYFHEDTTCTVSFREMVTLNY
jgi:hypothetical protein